MKYGFGTGETDEYLSVSSSNVRDRREGRSMIELRRRWVAFYVICLGTVMVVLDTTIVNVALPSIRASLGFSESSLAWVVNAYMLTFGGFLLLGGRLGDIYGHRRVFIIGITGFTTASVVCGLSTTQSMLITARAVQGIGGALASAVGLSLVIMLFTEPIERAKAMGITGFVASGGGALGVLLGGVLTDVLSWHWIFLVNVPIGIVVCTLMLRLVPAGGLATASRRLDVAGAFTITASLLLAVDAVVNGNQAGWTSGRTFGLLGASLTLFVAFLIIETRTAAPLIRLTLLRSRNLATANVVGVMWAAAMFAWFFISALYLQLVLGYDALHVGLAFLPSNLIMAFCSVAVSARLVVRFGNRVPLVGGLTLAAIGLLLLAQAPVDGHFAADVLPSMLLLGVGAGIAFNPVLMAAMGDVSPEDSGLASGLVNTSFMMGGALGLAVLASLAEGRTAGHVAADAAALLDGYHLAFFVGAALAAVGAVVGYVGLRPSSDMDSDADWDDNREPEPVCA
jgi:EmrB/QacA subfamily drug resistance transporter